MNSLVILCAFLAVSFDEAQAGKNDLKIFEVRQDNSYVYLKPYSAQKLLNQMNAAVNSKPSAPKKVDYFIEPVPIPFIGKKTRLSFGKKRQPVIVHKKQAKIMDFFDDGRRELSSDEGVRGTAIPSDRTGAPPLDEEGGLKADDDDEDDKSNK